MKKGLLIALVSGFVLTASAQHDDLYFVPKKKKVQAEVVTGSKAQEAAVHAEAKTVSVTTLSGQGLDMDEDTYNRRGAYLTESGDVVSEFAASNDGFVLITEEGDTMWMNTDTLRLTHISEGEGWVNGFDGSDADYEYAMRIVRFRNPRYAIPVSSPLYWDVVYGGALWPSWEWNIYDDGMYAYVFPTSSNWYYSDYMMGRHYGWGHYPYYSHYHHHHYVNYWGWSWYGSMWYDPWFNPYIYGYGGWYPAWHVGHHHGPHHGFYPGIGKPGWGGGSLGSRPIRNERQASVPATRRGTQDNLSVGRSATSSSRQGSTSSSRTEATGASRNSSVRVVTGSRTGVSQSGAVRSSSVRTGSEEVVRRGSSTSSTMSRSSSSSSSLRSGAGSSYNRPSSTRSSSSSVSRSSSSSSSSVGRSSSSSGSSRSSSYSGSTYSGSSSSYSGSSRSSYSGGSSSYSGGSRGGGSYSSGGSRSGGSSGSRR